MVKAKVMTADQQMTWWSSSAELSFRIGDQLTSLDVDNFSFDESADEWLDLARLNEFYYNSIIHMEATARLGKCCQHLDHLSLSATKLNMDFNLNETKLDMASSCIESFSCLSHLFLKSNAFRSPKVSICPLFSFLPCPGSPPISDLHTEPNSPYHLPQTDWHPPEQNSSSGDPIQLCSNNCVIVFPGITHRR